MKHEEYLRTCLDGTGNFVAMSISLGNEEMAVHFAVSGLRAARDLGLYADEGPRASTDCAEVGTCEAAGPDPTLSTMEPWA